MSLRPSRELLPKANKTIHGPEKYDVHRLQYLDSSDRIVRTGVPEAQTWKSRARVNPKAFNSKPQALFRSPDATMTYKQYLWSKKFNTSIRRA